MDFGQIIAEEAEDLVPLGIPQIFSDDRQFVLFLERFGTAASENEKKDCPLTGSNDRPCHCVSGAKHQSTSDTHYHCAKRAWKIVCKQPTRSVEVHPKVSARYHISNKHGETADTHRIFVSNYNFEPALNLYPSSSSTVFATRPTTGNMLICMNACSELACRLAYRAAIP